MILLTFQSRNNRDKYKHKFLTRYRRRTKLFQDFSQISKPKMSDALIEISDQIFGYCKTRSKPFIEQFWQSISYSIVASSNKLE